MKGEQIEYFMKTYHKEVPFRQTISIDDIKKLTKIKAPEFFVFNLDQSHKKA